MKWSEWQSNGKFQDVFSACCIAVHSVAAKTGTCMNWRGGSVVRRACDCCPCRGLEFGSQSLAPSTKGLTTTCTSRSRVLQAPICYCAFCPSLSLPLPFLPFSSLYSLTHMHNTRSQCSTRIGRKHWSCIA